MENLKITEKSWVEVIKTPRLYYVRVYDPETDRYITRMTGNWQWGMRLQRHSSPLSEARSQQWQVSLHFAV